MKKTLILFTSVALLFCGAISVSSCGGNNDKKDNKGGDTTKTDTTKHASAYVCPMGPSCGKGDAAGKCPSCGAEMVANDKGLK
ncbi:MAG TPA: heavy metal-binding domain-containing protein [Bacteroidia bacterium]|jgi:hypothetical protein